MGDYADIKKVVIGAAIIAAIATAIGGIGQLVIDHWGFILVIILVIVGLIVRRKLNKRLRNMV